MGKVKEIEQVEEVEKVAVLTLDQKIEVLQARREEANQIFFKLTGALDALLELKEEQEGQEEEAK